MNNEANEQSTPSVANNYSTDVLSSIVELICEKSREKAEGASDHEIASLKATVQPILKKIESLNSSLVLREETSNEDGLGSQLDTILETEEGGGTEISSAQSKIIRSTEGNDNASNELQNAGEIGPLHQEHESMRLSHPLVPERRGSEGSFVRRPAILQRAPSESWKKVAVEAFNVIDDNGDGILQKEEVVAAVQMMEENGMSFSVAGNDAAEVAENMMREVDTDGNGIIDFDEFIEMMRTNVTGNSKNEYHHRMSLLATNVLLAHQKKLENSAVGNDMWMIHPFSPAHLFWDIMVSLLIVLTVITMPLSIGWEEINDEMFDLNLTVDTIFLLDVVKNFCTGIVDENDAVIMDHRIVRRKYLTGFFLPDFCSSIPLDLILSMLGQDDGGSAVSDAKKSLKMLKLLRMAKLFRLLRISRLANQVKNLSIWIEETLNIHISDGFTKLLRLGVGALVLGHWIGCFNFFIVRMHDFPEESWVVYAGLDDKDAYTQWSWSLFKALAQMIMIGFETPPFTNASCDIISHWCGIEHWITLCCLYIGAVFYSLLISSISSILQTANLASRHFEETLTQIDDYMRSKKLPSALREKVKDCFHLQHSNSKLYNEEEILDMLSPILRREIKLFEGRDLTVKVPILSTVTNRNFAEEMVAVIEPVMAFEDEVIFREDMIGDEMYFINSGVVEIYLSGLRNIEYLAIGDGCYFGEVSILLDRRRTASARTKTQCMLFKISKTKLLTVLNDFPETLKHMKMVAESRERRLNHYINPSDYVLLPQDKIDPEDCKTELFGEDASKVVSVKEEQTKLRRHSSIRLAAIQRSPTGHAPAPTKNSFFSARKRVAPLLVPK